MMWTLFSTFYDIAFSQISERLILNKKLINALNLSFYPIVYELVLLPGNQNISNLKISFSSFASYFR